jgi:hypothetical protein
MRKLLVVAVLATAWVLAVGDTPASALPQCRFCTCFNSCTQICTVKDIDGGSHTEICELWKCQGSPACGGLAPDSTSEATTEEAFINSLAGDCGDAQLSAMASEADPFREPTAAGDLALTPGTAPTRP